jgi:hypothetical protein
MISNREEKELAIGGVSYGFTFGASATDFFGTVSNIRWPSDVNGDAVQSFHTLKQVVCVSSTWMHWLLPRCSHPNDRDESTDTILRRP